MIDNTKICRNCMMFRLYYTKGKTSFFAQDCGVCREKSQITKEFDCCEKWQLTNEEPLWFKKKERLLRKLHALMQILEEELE